MAYTLERTTNVYAPIAYWSMLQRMRFLLRETHLTSCCRISVAVFAIESSLESSPGLFENGTRGGTKRKGGVESRIEYVFSVDWTASVEIREWTSCRNHALNMYSYAGEIREEQDRLNVALTRSSTRPRAATRRSSTSPRSQRSPPPRSASSISATSTGSLSQSPSSTTTQTTSRCRTPRIPPRCICKAVTSLCIATLGGGTSTATSWRAASK